MQQVVGDSDSDESPLKYSSKAWGMISEYVSSKHPHKNDVVKETIQRLLKEKDDVNKKS